MRRAILGRLAAVPLLLAAFSSNGEAADSGGLQLAAYSGQSTPPLPDVVPVGGPGGITAADNLVNDSFGSDGARKVSPGTSKPEPANFTSTDQFFTTTQPDASYGINGRGWDMWMKSGYHQRPGMFAKAAMKADHLELSPGTTGEAAFMVSHFEALPTATVSYYYEMRMQTGRGNLGDTWPAWWQLAGNDSTASSAGNDVIEIDYFEVWNDQQWNSRRTPNGFTNYLQTGIHLGAGCPRKCTLVHGPYNTTHTGPIDVTVTWNVLGIEETMNSRGELVVSIYFNGAFQKALTAGKPGFPSPPAIIMGWNPGVRTSAPPPHILAVDYVRVWKKQQE